MKVFPLCLAKKQEPASMVLTTIREQSGLLIMILWGLWALLYVMWASSSRHAVERGKGAFTALERG
jgi:hypothetical protein